MSRSGAWFCIGAGASILLLWTVLLATGNVEDIRGNAVSLLFHWTAEFLTALLLIVAGSAVLRPSGYARRLCYFALGMLLIASAGMLAFYLLAGNPPFVAIGTVVLACTVILLARSGAAATDLLYTALGTVLYGELNSLGRTLQAGETASASYIAIMLIVTLPLTLHVLRRPL